MKNLFIKLAAWMVLVSSGLVSLGILASIFWLTINLKDANLTKLVLIDMGIVVLAIFVFILGLGIYEFVLSFIKLEEKLENVQEEVAAVERATGLPPSPQATENPNPKSRGTPNKLT